MSANTGGGDPGGDRMQRRAQQPSNGATTCSWGNEYAAFTNRIAGTAETVQVASLHVPRHST